MEAARVTAAAMGAPPELLLAVLRRWDSAALTIPLPPPLAQQVGHTRGAGRLLRSAAVSSRTESLLEAALKSARSSIVAAAATCDGTDGGGTEAADGERGGAGGALLEADGGADAPPARARKYFE